MLHFVSGNMWDCLDLADLFLITTNAYRRKDGSLVMGRGIALEAKTRFPELPSRAGNAVLKARDQNGFYGILLNVLEHQANLGLFQVKYRYDDKAEDSLIHQSCWMLSLILTHRPQYRNVHLNYPGIGAGGLSKSIVSPILHKYLNENISANVFIWSCV